MRRLFTMSALGALSVLALAAAVFAADFTTHTLDRGKELRVVRRVRLNGQSGGHSDGQSTPAIRRHS